MLGQGRRTMRNPSWPAATGFPNRSTTSARTPGNGRVPDPGFNATAPGMGAIMMAPVSVCHHVSTIGQRSWPMAL